MWLAKRFSGKNCVEAPVSALKLNDIVLLFLPSEVFVDHQLRIKEASSYETIVVSYADDYFGYIPTRESFDEGGYEASYPGTILRKGEGEKLVKKALELLNSGEL